MIIIIILIAIVIIGLVLLFIGLLDRCYYDEMFIGFGGVGAGIFGFALLVCGAICIAHNTQSYVLTKTYELQERIELFENEKYVLESYRPISEQNQNQLTSNITFEIISTSEYYNRISVYNKEVYNFKVQIKGKKYALKNVWVNWFCCPAYENISDEALEKLSYTIGRN